MKKLKIKIARILFSSEEVRKALKDEIKKEYRETARENLHIKTKLLRVKKGERRYDVIFFETPKGQLRFNLGRFWYQDGNVAGEIPENILADDLTKTRKAS